MRIKTEEVGVEGSKLDRECHAALKMELCRGLVAQKVVSIAHPPLRPDGAGRVLGSLRDDAGLFRDRQGVADVANPREKDGQTEEKAQLASTVLVSFRKRKPTLDCGANLICLTPGVHRRKPQGFLKDHFLSGPTAGVVESGQRPVAPSSAFFKQR
jgi:hypothetical protein